VSTLRIRDAAVLLGVSDDTVRRWADIGRLSTTTDASGRLVIDGVVLARFAEEMGGASSGTPNRVVVSESIRNRFTGLVTRVVRDTVMAQVEIQSGPSVRVAVEPRGGR
jgi:excisionase family DNA binding protein